MTWRYRPELDGLRTVAVYLVLLYHSGMAWASGGFIGVDLFFVLSGFLVLNVMLAEVDQRGRLSLGDFYARRFRRLLPAAVVVVVLTSFLVLLTTSLPERLPQVRDAQSALLYVSNWHFLAAANDYFATNTDKSPFLHFWSLSVEEQFYFLFPLLVALVVRLGRHRSRGFLGLLLGLAAASALAQVLVARVDVNRAYYGTDTRLYQLLAGAALAVAFRELGRHRRDGGQPWPRAVPAVVAGVGLAALVLLASGVLDLSVSSRGLLATVAALAAIGGVYAASGSLLARAMGSATPAYLGRISYGTYLWHWPVVLVVGQVFDARPAVIAVVTAAVATGLAALSHQVLETPVRRSSLLLPRRLPTIAGGLAVSVLVALAVVPSILDSEKPPVIAAGAADGSLAGTAASTPAMHRRVPHLDFEKVLADRGPDDTWCTPDDVQECLVVPGGGPHVVLVGDSQARMLAPAFQRLAREKGFQLYVDIVSSCPWQDGLYDAWSSPDNQRQCHEARDDFYRTSLPQMDPDLVVTASLARSAARWQGHIVDRDGRSGDLAQMMLKATRSTAELVEQAGAKLVMFHSVMGTGGYDSEGPDPLDCLARARTLGSCAVVPPLREPIVDGFYDTVATDRADVATVDVNPIICPDAPVCLPMLGDVVVWRNSDHLTGAVTARLRGKIWQAIEDTGLQPRG